MRARHRRTSQSAVLIALAVLGGCSSTSKRQTDDLRAVDDLVGRIERVYVESEVSKERVGEAMRSLRTLTAPDFAGDPVAAYEGFVFTIEASEDQASELTECIEAMEEDAASVFKSWQKDLDSFQSQALRSRSEARLAETRARYSEIVAAVEPVRTGYEEVNAGLRDHATYFGHDFNPRAVSDLAPETTALDQRASALNRALDVCLERTLAYVQSAALPGQIEEPPPPEKRAGG